MSSKETTPKTRGNMAKGKDFAVSFTRGYPKVAWPTWALIMGFTVAGLIGSCAEDDPKALDRKVAEVNLGHIKTALREDGFTGKPLVLTATVRGDTGVAIFRISPALNGSSIEVERSGRDATSTTTAVGVADELKSVADDLDGEDYQFKIKGLSAMGAKAAKAESCNTGSCLLNPVTPTQSQADKVLNACLAEELSSGGGAMDTSVRKQLAEIVGISGIGAYYDGSALADSLKGATGESGEITCTVSAG